MKRILITLISLFFTLISFGQSSKIVEYSTSHIMGREISGIQKMATRFEVYKDSVVVTIIEPSAVSYLKKNNLPLSQTLECQVQKVDQNSHGLIYFYGDEGGEIVLRVYKEQPSSLLRVKRDDGTIDEKSFINIVETHRM